MCVSKRDIFHMKNICGFSSTPRFSRNHRADEAARTVAAPMG